jgi:hypothetical protein
LEPGTGAILQRQPAQIRLQQARSQQAAWEAASLVTETAQNKLEGALWARVAGKSPTRKALVTCVENGYTAGQTLAEAQETPAEHLGDTLGLYKGLYGNAATCATVVTAVAERERPGTPVLTVDDLARTTTDLPWQRRVNVYLQRAVRALKVLPF